MTRHPRGGACQGALLAGLFVPLWSLFSFSQSVRCWGTDGMDATGWMASMGITDAMGKTAQTEKTASVRLAGWRMVL
jgi:hypothetical protein